MKAIVIFVFVVCCLTNGCGYHLVRVPTGAMQPTIRIDANVVIDKTAYLSNKPIERFDLVIHKAPVDEKAKNLGVNEDTKYIFRVVALGGEKVEIKKGKVLINDTLLAEPFDKIQFADDFKPITVPDNEFFLLGDNRPGSNDSRFWKPATIKRENIFGKVVQIF